MVISDLTPVVSDLKYEFINDVVIDGHRVYTIYMRCNKLVKLPLDPNPRDPVEDKKPYKDMKKTLIEEPEMFFFKNLGINTLASNVVVDKIKKIAHITFKPGLGVVNGGHTMKAILDVSADDIHIDNSAYIRIEVIEFENFEKDTVVEIAQSKNLTSVLKETSKANLLGYYDDIKKRMNPQYVKKIVFYEGDAVETPAMNGDDLIAILNMFNVKKYGEEEQPLQSVQSKSSVFMTWESENKNGSCSLACTYNLVDSILELKEYIAAKLNIDCGRSFNRLAPVSDSKLKKPVMQPLTGLEKTHNLPAAMIYPVLAAFRADTKLVDGYIEWIEDPKMLFDRIKMKMITTLVEAYNQDQNVSKFSRNKLMWKLLYGIVKSEKCE